MIVAIKAARWGDVGSLSDLLGLDEFEYLALYVWLAIAGAGRVSLDYLIQRWYDRSVRGRALSTGAVVERAI
jgi:putative oxidoreductase